MTDTTPIVRRLIIVSHTALSPEQAWRAALSPRDLCRASFPMLGMAFEGEVPTQWEQGKIYRVLVRQFSILPAQLFEIEFKRIDSESRTFITEERGGAFTRWQHKLVVTPSAGGGSRITDEIELTAKKIPVGALPFVRGLYRFRRWRMR